MKKGLRHSNEPPGWKSLTLLACLILLFLYYLQSNPVMKSPQTKQGSTVSPSPSASELLPTLHPHLGRSR